jgi:hypothetical protein
VSQDGAYVVSASSDETLKIWDGKGESEPVTLAGHTAAIWGCAISPDDRFIVSGGSDETLKIWDLGRQRETGTLVGGVDEVSDCAVSPDGSFIVSVNTGRTENLTIWETESGQGRTTLNAHPRGVWGCAISPDGKSIVSSSVDKTLVLWDAETGSKQATLEGHDAQIRRCAFSPDGSFIVSASRDRTLKIWDTVTGEVRATLEGHTDWVGDCAVSPDGAFLVSAGYDKTLRIWGADAGEEKALLPLMGALPAVALHPREPLVVCGDVGGNLILAELVGIEYGSTWVTAVDTGQGPAVRCPSCQRMLPLRSSWIGRQVTCPEMDCQVTMRVNPFIAERPRWVGAAASGVEAYDCREMSTTPSEKERRATSPDESVTAPAPIPPATVEEILANTDLRYGEFGDGILGILFPGRRIGRVIVEARDLPGGLAQFAVGLPDWTPLGDQLALAHVLYVGFMGHYVKAFSLESGRLMFASQLPSAVLDPPIAEGLIRGLAHIGDVRVEDLLDPAGWRERLVDTGYNQSHFIKIDLGMARRELESMLESEGLPFIPTVDGFQIRIEGFEVRGRPLQLFVRLRGYAIGFNVGLEDMIPWGNQQKYLERLLQLNRPPAVARVGLGSRGLGLLFEVPVVYPGLVQQVIDEVGVLLPGVLELHAKGG